MGSSSSTERRPSADQQEQEALAASTGSLPSLKSSFSILSNPQSLSIPLSSLHQTLTLTLTLTLIPPSSTTFPLLLPHLGPAAADLLFSAGTAAAAADWTAFLRGFNRCCARMPASSSLILLYRLFSDACNRAGIACGLEFDSEDADDDGGKVRGAFRPSEMEMFLWLCWAMEQEGSREGGEEAALPDLSHLVLSAFSECGEVGGDGIEGLGDLDGKIVEVRKLDGWILATVPRLVNCFAIFLKGKIRSVAVSEESSIKSSLSGSSGSSTNINDSFLLTFGRAWAISLTQKSTLGEELSAASFPGLFSHKLNNLLYRSSTHGKGLSRFWSIVEGYHGPLLFLFSGILADLADSSDDKSSMRRWVVGVLTEHGFQNSDIFYGSSAHLYAISPIFRVLSPTGKEKNFIYSHMHPTGRVYETNPKPVGLAFGGTRGNERIFIDEDFSRVVIRHHAVDKTYQHGSLIPNQGYLPVEASLVEAEVWGFGGSSAKEQHDNFKKREKLFTEQRRKVDLKTFGSWEDSPEKMMMDMVSDPNRVQREDR